MVKARWKKGAHESVKKRNSQRIKQGKRTDGVIHAEGVDISKRKIHQQY